MSKSEPDFIFEREAQNLEVEREVIAPAMKEFHRIWVAAGRPLPFTHGGITIEAPNA